RIADAAEAFENRRARAFHHPVIITAPCDRKFARLFADGCSWRNWELERIQLAVSSRLNDRFNVTRHRAISGEAHNPATNYLVSFLRAVPRLQRCPIFQPLSSTD